MLGGEGAGKDGAQGAAATMKKGPWTVAEDAILMEYVKKHGEGNWNAVQRNSGLSRCGKSCRLRWANHLRPNLKKGAFTPEEERLILELHAKLGNKWARMATQLPGRTDNEIKNYWNTRIKRRQRAGLPLYPPDIRHLSSFHHHHHHRLQIDNKVAQFDAVPAPLPLFDPNRIGSSSSSSSSSTLAAAIPSSLTDYSFAGESQPLLGHTSNRSQAPLKRPREESWAGISTMFFGAQASPSDRLGSGDYVTTLYQQHSSSSIEMELPSNQFAPAPAGDGDDPWARNNSGLLDALLVGARTKRASSAAATTSNDKPNGGSSGLSAEGRTKNKQPVNEDVSALLHFLPPSQASTAAAGRFNNDSREVSNGQSSGVTDDEDIGFDMQQLASSLNAAAGDHNWNVGSDRWDNMPSIC